MVKIRDYTVDEKTTRITEYDDISEIIAVLEENGLFHDGTIEFVGHDEECTTICFKHYEDPEYTFRRLVFTGNVELTLNLDLSVRMIYEISLTVDDKIDVFFDGTGIIVRADNVKFQTQELLN